jgi:H+/Cl- antiporter ClcA
MSRLKVYLFAAIGGALTGLISFAFLRALDWATRTRIAHGWLVWLLPVAGFVVAAAYHYKGGRAKGGTPMVLEQAHTFTHGVPSRMAPLIFGGAVGGHLVGASVGREGAALQMAGSVTDTAARWARLTDNQRRTLIAASLAGGWGAVFGVPITGIVFTLQVTKRHRWRAFIPAIIAAYTGKWVVDALGYTLGDRPHMPDPDWTLLLPLKLALAGIGVGLIGRLFVALLKVTKRRAAHRLHWPPLRAAVGGGVTIALLLLCGRDYLGLSSQLYSSAIAGNHIDIWVPLLKMLFTVVALGTGFVGGEVLPLFVMGSTFGAAVAPGLHVNATMLASAAAPAAFASAASVTLTGVVLTVEQFGWGTLWPALIVGMFARLAAGRPGLYVAH